MPNFKHIVSTPYVQTFRSTKIEGMFDLDVGDVLQNEWDVDIPVDIDGDDWNIGVIVGPSGCGKTSIGKVAFGEDNYHTKFEWAYDKSVVDGFPEELTVEQITKVLSSVGFSSPPCWLQPFHTLSNGQKFRVELARIIVDDKPLTVVDEFTSVVDRTVAKIGSHAIQKTTRKMNKKLVLLSCHYDVLEWLEPDWVYYADTGTYSKESLRRPEICIEIKRCHRSAWGLFKDHHYLSEYMSPAAVCYIAFVDGQPAAFYSLLNFGMSKLSAMMRGHRLVVLPDYQGIGLGNIMSKSISEHYADTGWIVTMITSHPALIAARSRDNDFRMTRKIEHIIPTLAKSVKNDGGEVVNTEMYVSGIRITGSFQYIGNRPQVVAKHSERRNMLTALIEV